MPEWSPCSRTIPLTVTFAWLAVAAPAGASTRGIAYRPRASGAGSFAGAATPSPPHRALPGRGPARAGDAGGAGGGTGRTSRARRPHRRRRLRRPPDPRDRRPVRRRRRTRSRPRARRPALRPPASSGRAPWVRFRSTCPPGLALSGANGLPGLRSGPASPGRRTGSRIVRSCVAGRRRDWTRPFGSASGARWLTGSRPPCDDVSDATPIRKRPSIALFFRRHGRNGSCIRRPYNARRDNSAPPPPSVPFPSPPARRTSRGLARGARANPHADAHPDADPLTHAGGHGAHGELEPLRVPERPEHRRGEPLARSRRFGLERLGRRQQDLEALPRPHDRHALDVRGRHGAELAPEGRRRDVLDHRAGRIQRRALQPGGRHADPVARRLSPADGARQAAGRKVLAARDGRLHGGLRPRRAVLHVLDHPGRLLPLVPVGRRRRLRLGVRLHLQLDRALGAGHVDGAGLAPSRRHLRQRSLEDRPARREALDLDVLLLADRTIRRDDRPDRLLRHRRGHEPVRPARVPGPDPLLGPGWPDRVPRPGGFRARHGNAHAHGRDALHPGGLCDRGQRRHAVLRRRTRRPDDSRQHLGRAGPRRRHPLSGQRQRRVGDGRRRETRPHLLRHERERRGSFGAALRPGRRAVFPGRLGRTARRPARRRRS